MSTVLTTASIPEVCFSAAEVCNEYLGGKCKRIHLALDYFVKFQEACTKEMAAAIERMKELKIYDSTRKVQLKWYACESGKNVK